MSAAAARAAPAGIDARNWLTVLLDEGSFAAAEGGARHGALCGGGTIDGRPVRVWATDPAVRDGSVGTSEAHAIAATIDAAIDARVPVIGIVGSAGIRAAEAGVEAALDAWLAASARAAGVVPQFAAITGPCVGALALPVALADVRYVTGDAHFYLAGPDVVRRASGATIGRAALGGAEALAASGIADRAFDDVVEALTALRDLAGYLPSSRDADPPRRATDDPATRAAPALDLLVPDDPAEPYDIRDAITAIADEGAFLELQRDHAVNLVCGLARLAGQPAGVVATQPAVLGGALDVSACRKGARFVALCDAFSLPLVTIVDTPGFVPGAAEERAAVAREAAALAAAYARARMRRVALVVRCPPASAAGRVLAGQPDVRLAWPEVAPRDTRAALIAALSRSH